MVKPGIAVLLMLVFGGFSFMVYTQGTETGISLPAEEMAQANRGKTIYQEYNCQSCHQIYGLGGYLGPDLTTAWSDKYRGEGYLRALLKSGGARMPNFNFREDQIDDIITYLKYVDTTARKAQNENRR